MPERKNLNMYKVSWDPCESRDIFWTTVGAPCESRDVFGRQLRKAFFIVKLFSL